MRKKMRTNNLEELLKTIEKIRVEKYPHISKELVEEIISAEFENQDNRAVASRKTSDIVSAVLDKKED